MERWRQIESVFQEALKRDPAQRDAYVRDACHGDSKLQSEVSSLLANHLEATESEPWAAASAAQLIGGRVSLEPGQLGQYDGFGPYRILRAIGEGGMGTVYLAEQTHPIQRQVALKVVKPGMDTQQILSRFNYERQALALMDHPNIARVYDANATEKGRPYFVMEHIDGLPITEYCDRHRLNTEERLELILPICQALQHAHQKGVLHRDIKPSNLLVKVQDGRPVPKIIDFGIAKATGQGIDVNTALTQLGQFVGHAGVHQPGTGGRQRMRHEFGRVLTWGSDLRASGRGRAFRRGDCGSRKFRSS